MKIIILGRSPMDDDIPEPIDVTLSSLEELRPITDREREALAPVLTSLRLSGFYAYGTFDEQQRWTIAVDDEAGRVDVRIGEDGFEVVVSTSSPGMFADEENEWKRRAQERLARMQVTSIARGQLAPHQTAYWDEVEHGVAARVTYGLPFSRAAQVGAFVREHFPEADEVLSFVESQIDV